MPTSSIRRRARAECGIELGQAAQVPHRRSTPAVPGLHGERPCSLLHRSQVTHAYVVNKGHENYSGGSNDLVFLGARLGDVTSSGVTWCASNANAAAATTQFTTDITALGTFVDFTVLRQRDWYKTTEDPDRMSRRAAEVLVLGEVPLTLVTIVATRSDAVLHEAQAA